MPFDSPAETVQPEPANDHPELERPESAPELRRVFVVIVDRRDPIQRAQIFRDEAERIAQHRHPRCQQEGRVKRREEPLVRVDDDRIGALPADERPAPLRNERHDAGVGAVDVQPQILAPGDISDRADRVDRGRRRGPERGDDRDRTKAGGAVGRDCLRQRFGAHAVGIVGLDSDEALAAQAQRHARLLDRRMRFR